MAEKISAEQPDKVQLEILSPEAAEARGLDSKKSISIYLGSNRIPIQTALSKTKLEKRILQELQT
ncbi:MAG: hypothetical protein ACLFM3_09100 [Desulfohalobiaceae bacterium]